MFCSTFYSLLSSMFDSTFDSTFDSMFYSTFDSLFDYMFDSTFDSVFDSKFYSIVELAVSGPGLTIQNMHARTVQLHQRAHAKTSRPRQKPLDFSTAAQSFEKCTRGLCNAQPFNKRQNIHAETEAVRLFEWRAREQCQRVLAKTAQTKQQQPSGLLKTARGSSPSRLPLIAATGCPAAPLSHARQDRAPFRKRGR